MSARESLYPALLLNSIKFADAAQPSVGAFHHSVRPDPSRRPSPSVTPTGPESWSVTHIRRSHFLRSRFIRRIIRQFQSVHP